MDKSKTVKSTKYCFEFWIRTDVDKNYNNIFSTVYFIIRIRFNMDIFAL